MVNAYIQFVKKHYKEVFNQTGSATETISKIAKMYRAEHGKASPKHKSPRRSSSRSPSKYSPSRRCSNKHVLQCHKKKRVCNKSPSGRQVCHKGSLYPKVK